MFEMMLSGWRYRHFVRSLVKRDISGSYSGSVLGIAWAFVDPAMYVLLTMFFFQFAIRGVPTSGVPYVAWVLPVIIFWTFISNCINSSVGAVREYGFLLRHKQFDLRLIVVVKLLAGLVIHAFLISAVMLVLYLVLGVPFGIQTAGLLYYLFSACMLLTAIGLIVSSFGAFWKDVRNIVSIVLQVEFWVSPIFWDAARFPAPVRAVMYVNPLYYPMHGYRESVIYGSFGPNFVWMTVYFWSLVAFLFWLGSRVFVRLESSFGDVV